ncbi:DUF6046 domain-containing protein [Reichenbachiella sp.]|uniref:DUF6046 domain-containing protein n=1 Tax=Reichenbachiella sp. TaxID=2184521 RepID=UPI003B58BC4E
MAEFDLYDVTRKVGHVAPPYPALGVGKGANQAGTIIKTVKGAFNFNNEFNGEDFFPVKIAGWQIPDEPIISIVGSNHIVETPLNRGQQVANVLEQINLNNYKVKIIGVLYGSSDDEYPSDLVGKLRTICEGKGSHDIECPMTDLFSIKKIAIKRFSIPGAEASPNEQPFMIEAISDTTVPLELINEENE